MTYSHAETALPSSGNALISFNLGIVQPLVKGRRGIKEKSSAGDLYLSRSLVGLSRAEECCCDADDGEGEDDGKVFHVCFRLLFGDSFEEFMGIVSFSLAVACKSLFCYAGILELKLKNGGKINRVEVWCQYRRRTYSLSQTRPKLIWIVGIIIVSQ
jgi:hypothetical protein